MSILNSILGGFVMLALCTIGLWSMSSGYVGEDDEGL